MGCGGSRPAHHDNADSLKATAVFVEEQIEAGNPLPEVTAARPNNNNCDDAGDSIGGAGAAAPGAKKRGPCFVNVDASAPTKAAADPAKRLQREASQRIKPWAADKDAACMLGSLADWSDDFPAFESGDDSREWLIQQLRTRPAALQKAFSAAAAALHPDKHAASPERKALALALLQALAVAVQSAQSKPPQDGQRVAIFTAPSEKKRGGEHDDADCVVS